MSWFGALTGGAIGGMLGGPWGAAFGALLGHWAEEKLGARPSETVSEAEEKQARLQSDLEAEIAAMRAGSLDGHFGDIINVLMQNENGAPQVIVATTSHSSPNARIRGTRAGRSRGSRGPC